MKKLTMFIFGLCVGASLFIFALNSGCSPSNGSSSNIKPASDAGAVPETDVAEKEWMTNLEAAMKLSEKTGKPILLEFAGSNWCPPCIMLKKEVFSKKIFKDFAKKNLILVLMDFPRPSNQTDKQKKYNNNIAGKYKIQLFPTVLLLDSKGKVIAQTDYDGEDAKKYIELLKSKIPAKK